MRNINFLYDVGDIVESAEIIERKIINGRAGYMVRCLNDGYEYETAQVNFVRALKNGHTGCRVCTNHVIIDGINSLADLNPDLAEWFIDKELAHKIPLTYKKEVCLECPNCHNRLSMKPCNISTVPACVCGDGVSYPEKMFACVLKQLGVNYIHQLTKRHFEWCLNYRYDFYFKHNDIEYIFELDGGLGHGGKDLNGRGTLEIDIIKDNLAQQNGISVYRINADYPDVVTRFDYMKEQIVNSHLSDLFDLNDIDWNIVKKNSVKSKLVDLCRDFSNGETHIKSLANKHNVSYKTAKRYLKIGTNIGLCNYNPMLSYQNYIDNYLDDNSHVRIIKVGYMDNEYYMKRISSVPHKLNEMFGIDIDISTIYKHLSNPNKKSRKGLTFSYATEEEIENLKEVI